MNPKNIALVISILLTFCSQSYAQQTTTTLDELSVDAPKSSPDHYLLIDMVPVLISSSTSGKFGAGLIYNYRIGNRLSVGAFGEIQHTNDKDGILFFEDVEFQRTKIGLELRGYLSEFGRGLYGSLGPVTTTTKMTGAAVLSDAASFDGSDSKEQNGVLARLGYTTALGSSHRATAMILDAALEYGAGNEWTYSADSTGKFEIDEVTSGLSFNVGLGATF